MQELEGDYVLGLEYEEGIAYVTPRSQKRPKISFSEKSSFPRNGGIDGPYP